MSKNKGFSDTSVNSYSLALYELAEESKSINEIEEQSYAFINLILKSNDFKLLIIDPTSKKEDQLNIIMKISEKYKFPSGIKLTVDVDPINFN